MLFCFLYPRHEWRGFTKHFAKLKAEFEKERIDDFNDLNYIIENNENETIKVLLDILKKEDIDINEKLNYNYMSYEMIDEKYSHIKKQQEILLIGGAAIECLLEEYISLKIGGYENVKVDENLVYGNSEYLKTFIDSINNQMEILEKELNKANNLKIYNSFPKMF